MFIVFVARFPRKPKLPFANWYSTYARSFAKAAYSFPTRKNCALLPIALAIPQSGVIRFVWQSLPPHPSTPVLTKQMPCPCNHRQQGFLYRTKIIPPTFQCHQAAFSIRNIRRRYRKPNEGIPIDTQTNQYKKQTARCQCAANIPKKRRYRHFIHEISWHSYILFILKWWMCQVSGRSFRRP